MWTLEKGVTFLPHISLEKLQKNYSNETHGKAKIRLLAALHRKEGKSIDAIALKLSVSRRTVHGWLTRFQQRGLLAKRNKAGAGRKPELTVRNLQALRRDLLRGPPHDPVGIWFLKDVKHLLKEKYKVTYSRIHVFRILHTLGFSFTKPRQQHYKADVQKQKAFKKKVKLSHAHIGGKGGWSHVSMSAQ